MSILMKEKYHGFGEEQRRINIKIFQSEKSAEKYRCDVYNTYINRATDLSKSSEECSNMDLDTIIEFFFCKIHYENIPYYNIKMICK